MKVLVAGATGALGKHLVKRLVANDHAVIGTTRSEAKLDMLRELGATPMVMDAIRTPWRRSWPSRRRT